MHPLPPGPSGGGSRRCGEAARLGAMDEEEANGIVEAAPNTTKEAHDVEEEAAKAMEAEATA